MLYSHHFEEIIVSSLVQWPKFCPDDDISKCTHGLQDDFTLTLR